MSNTNLKVWVDDYIRQMEYEQEDEATLEEQECKGYLETPYDYYELGVEHGIIDATLTVLKKIKELL